MKSDTVSGTIMVATVVSRRCSVVASFFGLDESALIPLSRPPHHRRGWWGDEDDLEGPARGGGGRPDAGVRRGLARRVCHRAAAAARDDPDPRARPVLLRVRLAPSQPPPERDGRRR